MMKTAILKISRTIVLAVAILAGTWSVSYSQSKIPSYLSIGGWLDGQYTYERQMTSPSVFSETNTFQMRRARLDVKGGVTDKIEFRLQADFAGSPKMIDAFIKLKFNKYFNLEAGQFKTPFTLENQYSPLNQEGIDNSVVINKLAGFSDVLGANRGAGRDIGLMLYGNLLESSDGSYPIVSYNLGVFNGNGINGKDDNVKKDFIGRIDFHPFIKELVLSASVMSGTFPNGLIQDARNERLSFGAEYKDDALTVRSEYVRAEIGHAYGDDNYDGFYVVAGYWFKLGESQKLRPVARYDQFNQNGKRDNQYLFGLDWWPESHLRFQVNYTVRDRAQYDQPGNLFQAMLSVKF